ncbi:MAG: Serine--tRNA ligase [Alphaproteobacteria bacterium ADurb.Bin438]|nr:MAG: Serine--tRNA ligase [Alphaproteobacteria bacterium ADurb.Bin438]
MLDIKFIRENPDVVKTAVKNKNIKLDVDLLLKIDMELLNVKNLIQNLSEEKNRLSLEIRNNNEEAKTRALEVKVLIKENEEALKEKEQEFKKMMLLTPTIPSEEVPIGIDASFNVVTKKFGEIRKFDFKPKSHIELLDINDLAEFNKITKICGSRTLALKNNLARLEMALWQFTYDILFEKGFTLFNLPSVVFEEALYGTGHFPNEIENTYALPKDKQYLTGTAEVVLNGIHKDEILNEDDLPIKYAGFSPCFRREAGSYGKDIKGLIRVHQFMKVEQFIITKNDLEESEKMYQFLLNNTEELLQKLKIPYQIIMCSTGDMGVGKYKMQDVECYLPSENRYIETHSCSNLHEFQARRTNIRYRENKTNKVKFVHTLNNTGLATPRILAAIIENYQERDGKIKIPEALRPYLRNLEWL